MLARIFSLETAQLMARMSMIEWLQEKKVAPLLEIWGNATHHRKQGQEELMQQSFHPEKFYALDVEKPI
jgi:hypothetical protein